MIPAPTAAASRPGLLRRAGLGRPELRAWAAYEIASTAVGDVVVTAVFPVYFASVAAATLPPSVATERFALATTGALLLVAVLAPTLGAIADAGGARKRMMAAFLALGAIAVALLFRVERGDWLLASGLFLLANVGLSGSGVFRDALLPHVARPDELDRTSTAGYALGYLGGAFALTAVTALIQRPAWFGLPWGPLPSSAQQTLPARLGFLGVAAWWVLFSLPLFRGVREPPRRVRPPATLDDAVLGTFARLGRAATRLGAHRPALLFVVAFVLYGSGIGTIIRMAVVYGTELGLDAGALLVTVIVVDLVGVPFAFLFAALSGWIGTKRAILLGVAAYFVAALLAYGVRTTTDFFVVALLVATVQGGTQALSRSLFASLIPPERSAELFGFFSVADKIGGVCGPALFAAVLAATGSSRAAILSTAGCFLAGGAVLAAVDVRPATRLQ
jgi:UMF1 family MFS transporter